MEKSIKFSPFVKRHIVKSITYRLLSTLIGFIGMTIFTGSIKIGATFGIIEMLYKPLQYFIHERIWYKINYGINSRTIKSKINQQKPLVIWFTGLSGSGKTTLANALNNKLSAEGYSTYLLDGDVLRYGLNKNLTFSQEDRFENNRRLSEVAKILAETKHIVLVSAIAPYSVIRENNKYIIGKDLYYEIFLSCDIESCMLRDPKGLYKKVEDNKIQNFTGIDSKYENPINSNLTINTNEINLDNSLEIVYNEIIKIIKL